MCGAEPFKHGRNLSGIQVIPNPFHQHQRRPSARQGEESAEQRRIGQITRDGLAALSIGEEPPANLNGLREVDIEPHGFVARVGGHALVVRSESAHDAEPHTVRVTLENRSSYPVEEHTSEHRRDEIRGERAVLPRIQTQQLDELFGEGISESHLRLLGRRESACRDRDEHRRRDTGGHGRAHAAIMPQGLSPAACGECRPPRRVLHGWQRQALRRCATGGS